MPFRSKAQQRWMFATKPEMAKEWADETKSFKKLPEKVKKKKKKVIKEGFHMRPAFQALIEVSAGLAWETAAMAEKGLSKVSASKIGKKRFQIMRVKSAANNRARRDLNRINDIDAKEHVWRGGYK